MRLSTPLVIAGLALVAAPALAQDEGRRIVVRDVTREVVREVLGAVKPGAYQGRNNGPEQTERFSRKVKIGRDGRFSLNNIAGDIVVSAGSGDEVSIEAVKRTRGDKSELANVQITVDDRAGRVDVRTEHEQNRRDRNGRSDHVSVDYTVTVPASVSVDLHSVSGSVKVSGVHGSLRAETVSGDVTIIDAPRLEAAKTVSGDVSLTGVTADGDLSAASVSGNVEYAGGIAKGGRYEINAHSGTVRLLLANPGGFELNANSFSGSIRSDLPLTIGGDATRRNDSPRGRRDAVNNHSMRATFGDGSATIVVRTFSGDIIIDKR